MSTHILNSGYPKLLSNFNSYNLYSQFVCKSYYLILEKKFLFWVQKYNIEVRGDINNFDIKSLEIFLRPYDKKFAQQKQIIFIDNHISIWQENLTIWFEESKLDTIAEWIQYFPNITDCHFKINYEGSLSITYESIIPFWLDRVQKLNKLTIDDYNLEEVPSWLENLPITSLSIGSSYLKSFPCLKKLKYQLSYLAVNDLGINNENALPQNLGEYQNLKVLSLPKLKKLPVEIGELKNLEEIYLDIECDDCRFHTNPMKLPSFIYNLTKLKVLSISGHWNWIDLSREIEKLKELTTLNLSRCNIINMPEEIGHLEKLISLRLYMTEVILPNSIKTLPNLDKKSKETILELELKNAWKDINVYSNNDKKDFADYIAKYPNSIYREEAEKRFNELSNPFKIILNKIKFK